MYLSKKGFTNHDVVCDRKDVEAAAGLSRTEARRKYREIASTAESGWDFSTRWGPSTTHVIPTDLNCFLLMMERNMQRFAQASQQQLITWMPSNMLYPTAHRCWVKLGCCISRF